MAKFHKSTALNFFLMFLIFSSIITLTNQKKHLRKLQATTLITIPTSSVKVTSTTPTTSLASTTNVTQTIPINRCLR